MNNQAVMLHHAVYTTFCSPEFVCIPSSEAFAKLHKQYRQLKHCVKKKISDSGTRYTFIFNDETPNLIVVRKDTCVSDLSPINGLKKPLNSDELNEALAKMGDPADNDYFNLWTKNSN